MRHLYSLVPALSMGAVLVAIAIPGSFLQTIMACVGALGVQFAVLGVLWKQRQLERRLDAVEGGAD